MTQPTDMTSAATSAAAPTGQDVPVRGRWFAGRSRAKGPADLRPDIQGMRAIAVGMVVLYHLWPKALPGGFVGVDVFFVISGYLITGHLLRTFLRRGRVGLADFWGRRARRLLPAAAVVLTATWLAARTVLPATQLPNTVEQIRASALYFQNWVLARNNADYLHSADAPSPVQHFWSLSVEEQFYLFWPFLFLVGALVARALGRRWGRSAILGLALAVFGASLWWSVHYTQANPAAAYFVTTTRIWELALGGLLTLVPFAWSSALARIGPLAWIGLGLVIASGFLLSGSTSFPGIAALLPVGGAALLIACGSASAWGGTSWLTSLRPLVFLGDVSYSLYLWHWPIIVLWKARTGPAISLTDGLAIVVGSVALAWLTKRFVEDPVRQARFVVRSPARSLATVLTVLVPVVLVAFYTPPQAFHGHPDSAHPGAAALAGTAQPEKGIPPVPSAAEAPLDFDPFSACETPIPSVTPRPCTYGSPSGAKLRVALIGDSVANQYRAILADAAQSQHWFVVTDLHGECPWTATMTARLRTSDPYTACHDWGRQVLHDMLTKYKPNVVITSERPVLGTPGHPKADATSFGQIAAGMVQYWRRLAVDGIRVVAVRESPEPGRNIPDCLSKPGANAAGCATPTRRAIVQHTPIDQAVARMAGGADLIDINSLVCGPTVCSPIVGNVTVYRDNHHLTQTYIRSLEPFFMRKLLATRAVRTARFR